MPWDYRGSDASAPGYEPLDILRDWRRDDREISVGLWVDGVAYFMRPPEAPRPATATSATPSPSTFATNAANLLTTFVAKLKNPVPKRLIDSAPTNLFAGNRLRPAFTRATPPPDVDDDLQPFGPLEGWRASRRAAMAAFQVREEGYAADREDEGGNTGTKVAAVLAKRRLAKDKQRRNKARRGRILDREVIRAVKWKLNQCLLAHIDGGVAEEEEEKLEIMPEDLRVQRREGTITVVPLCWVGPANSEGGMGHYAPEKRKRSNDDGEDDDLAGHINCTKRIKA